MIEEYLDCDVWVHLSDTGPGGVRANISFDYPDHFILQIQTSTHGTISARFGPKILAQLHRQVMS